MYIVWTFLLVNDLGRPEGRLAPTTESGYRGLQRSHVRASLFVSNMSASANEESKPELEWGRGKTTPYVVRMDAELFL